MVTAMKMNPNKQLAYRLLLTTSLISFLGQAATLSPAVFGKIRRQKWQKKDFGRQVIHQL